MTTKKKIIIIAIVLVVLSIVAYFVFFRKKKEVTATTETAPEVRATDLINPNDLIESTSKAVDLTDLSQK